jgi:uncharacterized protein (TIGR03067 family)
LQGKWVPESCLFRGKELNAEQLERRSITLIGNRAELTDPDSGQTHTGTFAINASRSPKHIDLIAPDGGWHAHFWTEWRNPCGMAILAVRTGYTFSTTHEPQAAF